MAEKFFAPCPRGLEPGLEEELTGLGARNVHPVHGGVAFTGDWALAWAVNLESRLATRVLWQVAHGRYRGEQDIYKLAYGVTWAKWFTPEQTMRVYVTARRSPLKSLEFITLRIKDAVCDHFRAVRGERPSIDTANPDVRIHAFLTADEVMLYVDTSGEPLYKRGFKHAAVEAPLKENLAAGILRMTGWHPSEALLDPMCGSGTFLIEAVQIALDIAPGLGRRFAFESLKTCDEAAWRRLRRAAEGSRSGPSTSRAITPSSMSSVKPISNMARTYPAVRAQTRPQATLSFSPWAALAGSGGSASRRPAGASSWLESLKLLRKSRIALPRSPPRFFSRLVPNSRTSTIATTIQWPILQLPISMCS